MLLCFFFNYPRVFREEERDDDDDAGNISYIYPQEERVSIFRFSWKIEKIRNGVFFFLKNSICTQSA